MGYQRPAGLFFVRARAYMSLIASALLLAAAPAAALSDAEVAALIGDLRAPKIEVRVKAADALVAAGPIAVPALVAEMKSYRQRGMARALVQRMGASAVPALVDLLDDQSLRADAAATLPLVIGRESSQRVPRLLACLREPALAQSCGTALVKASPAAKRFAPELLEALRDSAPAVRAFAAGALGQLEAKPAAAVEPLSKALSDAEPAVRMAAAAGLGQYGRRARAAVPLLKALEHDASPDVRVAAAEALKNING